MPNHRILKATAAVAGWVLAITLMAVATTDQVTSLRGWSLLVALGAWIPTHQLIVDHAVTREHEKTAELLQIERLRTEALVHAVAVAFAENELSRIGNAASRPGVRTP